MIYDSILGTIGHTPIVRIQRLAPKNVTMYVKCEFFNPASSVKDRLAIAIIEDAERSGTLKPGQTVVEATSGNTGIALAMVCAAKGYPFVAIMAESFSDRAPQDHAHVRREGDPHAGGRARHRHGAQGGRAGEEARLVPRAASSRTKRTPPITATPPARRSSGLRRQAARLLRHRLGHGRHAHRRWRDDPSRAAGHADHRDRAGGRVAAGGQAVGASQDPGLDAGLRAGRAEQGSARIASCR